MSAIIGTRIYDDAIYATERPVGTWWADDAGPPPEDDGELVGSQRTEVAVIGGGIAGLSLAWHLAKEGIAATVLDAAAIGWGASGRNGGFVSFGYTKRSLDQITASHGAEEARAVLAAQAASCADLLALVDRHRLEVDLVSGGELLLAHRPDRLRELEQERLTMRDQYGVDWPLLSRDALRERGFASCEAHGALHLPHAAGIQPLKYTFGLLRLARGAGARVHPHSPVVHWQRQGQDHLLRTAKGATLHAARVVVATNGFTTEGLDRRFDGVTLPVLSSILVTRPLTAAEQAAQGYTTRTPVADSRNLLFYIRLLADGRLLFGGRGGTDASLAGAERYYSYMQRRLGQMFPAWRDVPITHRWRGLVCLTADLIGRVGLFPDDPRTGYLLGCHGSGVAMSGHAARFLACRIAGRPFDGPFPRSFQTPPPRFPLPSLRLPALKAAYGWYRLKDEVLPG